MSACESGWGTASRLLLVVVGGLDDCLCVRVGHGLKVGAVIEAGR